MRERDVENKVCRMARMRGWTVLKFVSPGMRGMPDRLMLRHGAAVFIEFKAPGRKPTALQRNAHDLLRDAGMTIYVVDDVDKGMFFLSAWENQ